MEKRRFGVLLCAEDSEYVKKRHGGYFQVFVGLLGEEGEAWDLFRVTQGEFPDDGDLGLYDGFVITGSCNDAHADDPWICRLVALLRKLDSLHKKVLGICFGHQILTRALGGRTGRARKGWDIGVTTVNLRHSAKQLAALQIPASLTVVECHRDEVWELPPGAEAMAWSDKTGVEMFRSGDHLMGIQGHPEYTKDILLNLIDRLLHKNLIQVSHASAARDSLDELEPNREAWKRLCRSFLKSPRPNGVASV